MPSNELSGHSFLNPEHILKKTGLISGQWVADLGCGGGYFVLPAARIVGDDGRVYGVDILKTALSSVGSKARLFGLTNIHLVWANVEIFGSSKGIHDESIDVVSLTQLLSQSKKQKDIFKEANRILKKGGQLVVIDWNSDRLPFSPHKEEYVTVEEVKMLARDNYLKFEREIKVSVYHFCLLFKKT